MAKSSPLAMSESN